MARPMRHLVSRLERDVLPRGPRDVARQLAMFAGAYLLYQLVRGLVDVDGPARPIRDALRVIDLERALHVFVEPRIQDWTMNRHWLMSAADWTYLNAHYVVTVGALVFIYLRRNEHFDRVRNTFMVAMALALVGYAVYPTAPPWLMPAWGFTDSIRRFTGIAFAHGPASALLNLYAAIPSMHVCFALLVGGSMSRLSRRRAARVAWRLYPVLIAFVVVATANHYLTDVVLGGLTALAAGLVARAPGWTRRPVVA
jgi:membrane-associated phospholipid phosphatase